MTPHEQTSDLLDATLTTLEGDIANATPQTGTGIIDEWLEQLRQGENTKAIADSLEHLKTLLESNQLDTAQLEQLLHTLADQTQELSSKLGPEGDIVTGLVSLASALHKAAGQLKNQQ